MPQKSSIPLRAFSAICMSPWMESMPVSIFSSCSRRKVISGENEWKWIKAQQFDALSFWRSQNFLCQTKIHLHIVAVTNIFCLTKRRFAFCKSGFCASTKVLEEALILVKFLGWLKKFERAQNILGPVKGQGINLENFPELELRLRLDFIINNQFMFNWKSSEYGNKNLNKIHHQIQHRYMDNEYLYQNTVFCYQA